MVFSGSMATELLDLTQDLDFLDTLYAQYRRDPSSVDPAWRDLFARDWAAAAAPAPAAEAPVATARFGRVFGLVNAYRSRGHLAATLDPLEQVARLPHSELDPRTWGFTDGDLDTVVPSGGLFGVDEAPLGELLRRLRATYCGTLGVELMHISDPARRRWLEERMEPALNRPPIDSATRKHILGRLAAAEVFEHFIHTKYVGTKRFSLEGGDSLIPLLDLVLQRAGQQDVEEVVIGMAHRGRFNVLANIMGKRPADVFAEFEDLDPESVLGGGDVKYHLGFSSEMTTLSGKALHLSLAFNPSHLEAVDPVVLGRVRAKQRRRKDFEHQRVLSVLVHGDAAFAGQGLVAETLNLSELHGYRIGGTVHVIVNNQIGFTTASSASRSTPYPTDVAKMIQVPIFHVNGDDPEAVVQAVRLAMDYRRQFRGDVVIDLFCFRRYGHNEGDEPSFTQQLLYQKIERHPPVRQIYAERLVAEGVLSGDEAQAMVRAEVARLEEGFTAARQRGAARPPVPMLGGYWSGFVGGPDAAAPEADTGLPRELLTQIAERVVALPDGFTPHPKITRLLATRAEMGRGAQPLDWGMAETLAYGTLLWDGRLVRLSGQDTRRGTFSHRHAVLVDMRTGEEYTPLAHLKEWQAEFRIYDSMLSEAAVLGFEYGYSLDYPDALVAWEAQFGDFSNGAQVIIDQFVSSAEDKWKRLSGLVMLLPHGYEGQGPEHSSARFERFLQLTAEDNIQVCQPTTPAQQFHLLRRQVLRKWRKPLVILTPKSLLRLPEARSSLSDLAEGRFERILDDPKPPERAAVRRVILCSGKLYYELVQDRARRGDGVTALLRVEQLYPLADDAIAEALERYPGATEIVWVQDEPANMGALGYLWPKLARIAGKRAVRVVSRAESASPATGSYRAHQIEHRTLMDQAFGGG
jgi:2-oxoglutarate dehydrogenase E1 component